MDQPKTKVGQKRVPFKAIFVLVSGLILALSLAPFMGRDSKNYSPIDFNTQLSLLNDQDNSIKIESLLNQNKDSLFVLWATWCEPCIVELEEISKNKTELSDKYNLILVNLDGGNKDKVIPEVKAWLISQKFDLATYFDFDEVLIKTLGFASIPHSFALNTEKKLIWQNSGILNLEKL
jgi:thiol-disulfide isomerase/thioredoxin